MHYHLALDIDRQRDAFFDYAAVDRISPGDHFTIKIEDIADLKGSYVSFGDRGDQYFLFISDLCHMFLSSYKSVLRLQGQHFI